MKKIVGILSVAMLSMPLMAQTLYRCVDEETGAVTITNKKINKQCQALPSQPVNSIPAPEGQKTYSSKNAKVGTDPTFPKVQVSDQKARDKDRRLILSQELESEERALKQAQQEKAQERIAQHQRNIENIQKELEKIPE